MMRESLGNGSLGVPVVGSGSFIGRCCRHVARALVLVLACTAGIVTAETDSFTESPPRWERLLWGGTVIAPEHPSDPSVEADSQTAAVPAPSSQTQVSKSIDSSPGNAAPAADGLSPRFTSGLKAPVIALTLPDFPRTYTRQAFRELALKNIPPLYTTPVLPGEGIWEWRGLPGNDNGSPVMFRTTYRPSLSYANAIVHMLLFDMKRVSMRLHVGSSEPGAPAGASKIDPETRPYLLAITNALWKQKHSGGAGMIFRGEVLKKPIPGMATLVIYKDESVDVLEWNDGIPTDIILDARQLRHLMVKDGRVVESVVKNGERVDSEIGLGFLLAEDQLPPSMPWGGYYPGQFFGGGPQVNYGPDWFIATRSAFGIRKDGNLVFAIGHHISTKDLARGLVLAGCERAIHGDANPHNVLANLYFTDERGLITKREKLSPDQREDTLRRYVDQSYSSDFFAFLKRRDGQDSRASAGTGPSGDIGAPAKR